MKIYKTGILLIILGLSSQLCFALSNKICTQHEEVQTRLANFESRLNLSKARIDLIETSRATLYKTHQLNIVQPDHTGEIGICFVEKDRHSNKYFVRLKDEYHYAGTNAVEAAQRLFGLLEKGICTNRGQCVLQDHRGKYTLKLPIKFLIPQKENNQNFDVNFSSQSEQIDALAQAHKFGFCVNRVYESVANSSQIYWLN